MKLDIKNVLPAGSLPHYRLGIMDVLPWVVAMAVFFTFDTYLSLGAQILIMVIFGLSLDLALGFAGINTLGHAAFFGVGAYAAGWYALNVSPEPFTGLVVASAAAAVVGLLSGWLLLRTHGLALLMLTMVVTVLLHEVANAWTSVTGGADGLSGMSPAPLFGVFQFDLFGKTAYLYALGMVFLTFLIVRVVANSPFGLSIRGIRENAKRMHLVGASVHLRLVAAYTLSAALAGIAGGLSAQITKTVSLDRLTFQLSGDILIMLIIGGVGRLYGAFIGIPLYMLMLDRAAAINPFHWMFFVGLALILLVRFAPGGLMSLGDKPWMRVFGKREGAGQ
ncbi:amino acid/amide ABC transporter membrane protein 2, HAAT family [Noviherbaspirillum humi]|uniref:Amino acid/amide ABC transporter membrane protein 2, HAAT family n=1 Tax=Noviherbaspirillum humi TaxID=1688639 RepID=A0A239LAF0_9BURK|nr:branched-chain amino acid ABC transporter permease [Noviherbaspirillum humi]SNT27637.1 amino acid/amide ABC transporter membrane protein 2, HAAT family [Noviherbaspirillum humi]